MSNCVVFYKIGYYVFYGDVWGKGIFIGFQVSGIFVEVDIEVEDLFVEDIVLDDIFGRQLVGNV